MIDFCFKPSYLLPACLTCLRPPFSVLRPPYFFLRPPSSCSETVRSIGTSQIREPFRIGGGTRLPAAFQLLRRANFALPRSVLERLPAHGAETIGQQGHPIDAHLLHGRRGQVGVNFAQDNAVAASDSSKLRPPSHAADHSARLLQSHQGPLLLTILFTLIYHFSPSFFFHFSQSSFNQHSSTRVPVRFHALAIFPVPLYRVRWNVLRSGTWSIKNAF